MSHLTESGPAPPWLTCGGPDRLRRPPAPRLIQSGPSAPFSRRCLIEGVRDAPVRPDIDGDQTIGNVFMPVTEVWSRCQTARFVPAHPGAGLAGRAPGPPASTSSPRAGRQPAAALE